MESSGRKYAIAVAAGFLTGIGLIVIISTIRNGWLTLLPYAVLALASALYMRAQKLESFTQRFVACLIAFGIATLMADTYINTIIHPHAIGELTFGRYLAPLGAMILLGAAGSAIVAAISGSRAPTRTE
jgi:hypothetical protein